MFTSLLRLPEAHVPKFASLRYAVSGGAALPAPLWLGPSNFWNKKAYAA
jgi:hypothetical protein